ncbi:MAG: hydroxyacid dehydrogenase [Acidipropionibacterium sp.]|jgi:phosphoglycerate dehydrogenase-like enzyme|nr:hydroxyacid dehydrogenase [Acidipropionibacterium sp.]
MDTAIARRHLDLERLRRSGRLLAVVDSYHRLPAADLGTVDVLISGWGTPALDAAALASMPRLRAVLHTAGTVKEIVTPELIERGILVTNNVTENADPVAQYTLAALLWSGKRVPWLARGARDLLDPQTRADGVLELSNWHRRIGIIGFSRVGRAVLEALAQPFLRRTMAPRLLVADPYADAARVAEAGAELVGLDELLGRSDVVSLHAPNTPETRGMIGAREFSLMPDGATFINTARGALVDHDALLAECSSGRLSAILDVTDPEPLPADSPLLSCPGIVITPHVAGSLGTEIGRMADGALDELERLVAGRPPREPVPLAELARLA